MRAAVITSFGSPPRVAEVDEPQTADGELLVDVIAAGLHPRVRSQGDGSHYTSTGTLPLIPGIDGVGRDQAGALRYFVLPDTALGSMAERVAIDPRRSVVLAEHSDAVTIAAAMNPAMSSWIALRRRIRFEEGQSVLILGATGNAGRMAVQVARRLGASAVIGTGRNPDRLAGLASLGATDTVPLDGPPETVGRALAEAAADVDVVLDYLWGDATAQAMVSLITARTDRSRALTWVEIGSASGLVAPIPSAALRAARLQLVGSGQGSVDARDIVAELPALADEISGSLFRVDARTVALDDIERAWADGGDSEARIVITP
jgi:NADPH:quinone reductase-like Zn-dependent oxidoreductase